MGTVLITLGRLPKGLELARALAGAGCRVLVAEPWRWHLTRLSGAVDACHVLPPPATRPDDYDQALRDLVDAEDVDLVVPVSEEILHVSRTCRLPLPSRPTARRPGPSRRSPPSS